MTTAAQIFFLIIWLVFVEGHVVASWAISQPPLREMVQGKGCYSYGNDETPNEAIKKAEARARERAVSGYQVWVESSSKVEDFQLQEDVIHTISAGLLHKVTIEEEVWKEREICVTISAEIDPDDLKTEIARRQDQQKTKEQVTSDELTPEAAFGLTIELNKPDGWYLEGENLIITVTSERDAYLKLDYFQANEKVVHLVPNVYRGQAYIHAGKPETFGGGGGAERFVISEPFGVEVIKAIASVRPFPTDFNSQEMVSESQKYVETLKKGLQVQPGVQGTIRGIRIMSGATASLYTDSRVGYEHKQSLKSSP